MTVFACKDCVGILSIPKVNFMSVSLKGISISIDGETFLIKTYPNHSKLVDEATRKTQQLGLLVNAGVNRCIVPDYGLLRSLFGSFNAEQLFAYIKRSELPESNSDDTYCQPVLVRVSELIDVANSLRLTEQPTLKFTNKQDAVKYLTKYLNNNNNIIIIEIHGIVKAILTKNYGELPGDVQASLLEIAKHEKDRFDQAFGKQFTGSEIRFLVFAYIRVFGIRDFNWKDVLCYFEELTGMSFSISAEVIHLGNYRISRDVLVEIGGHQFRIKQDVKHIKLRRQLEQKILQLTAEKNHPRTGYFDPKIELQLNEHLLEILSNEGATNLTSEIINILSGSNAFPEEKLRFHLRDIYTKNGSDIATGYITGYFEWLEKLIRICHGAYMMHEFYLPLPVIRVSTFLSKLTFDQLSKLASGEIDSVNFPHEGPFVTTIIYRLLQEKHGSDQAKKFTHSIQAAMDESYKHNRLIVGAIKALIKQRRSEMLSPAEEQSLLVYFNRRSNEELSAFIDSGGNVEILVQQDGELEPNFIKYLHNMKKIIPPSRITNTFGESKSGGVDHTGMQNIKPFNPQGDYFNNFFEDEFGISGGNIPQCFPQPPLILEQENKPNSVDGSNLMINTPIQPSKDSKDDFFGGGYPEFDETVGGIITKAPLPSAPHESLSNEVNTMVSEKEKEGIQPSAPPYESRVSETAQTGGFWESIVGRLRGLYEYGVTSDSETTAQENQSENQSNNGFFAGVKSRGRKLLQMVKGGGSPRSDTQMPSGSSDQDKKIKYQPQDTSAWLGNDSPVLVNVNGNQSYPSSQNMPTVIAVPIQYNDVASFGYAPAHDIQQIDVVNGQQVVPPSYQYSLQQAMLQNQQLLLQNQNHMFRVLLEQCNKRRNMGYSEQLIYQFYTQEMYRINQSTMPLGQLNQWGQQPTVPSAPFEEAVEQHSSEAFFINSDVSA